MFQSIFFSINFSFKIKVFEYCQCSLRAVEWCFSFHICGVMLTFMLISMLTNTANSLLHLMLSLHSKFYPQAHRCLCFYRPSLNLLEDWLAGSIKVKDEKKIIYCLITNRNNMTTGAYKLLDDLQLWPKNVFEALLGRWDSPKYTCSQ